MVGSSAAASMPEHSVYEVRPQRQLVYKGQCVQKRFQLCFLVHKEAHDFRACGRGDGEDHRCSGVAHSGTISSVVQGIANHEHTSLHFVVFCLTISQRDRFIAGRRPVNLSISTGADRSLIQTLPRSVIANETGSRC